MVIVRSLRSELINKEELSAVGLQYKQKVALWYILKLAEAFAVWKDIIVF